MRKALHLAFALAVAGLAGAAGAQTPAVCPVATNTTWSGEIVLNEVCFVKSGATLTILPGTIVRGQPRQAIPQAGVTAGVPGALVVTQSGFINAAGTADNPIIFTTAATDNNNDGVADDVDAPIGFDDPWDSGDTFLDDDPLNAPLAPLDGNGQANLSKWGGVVILGSAPTNLQNKCGVGYGKCTVEGLTFPGFPASDALYGGEDPHDSSGIMQYVSIRHGGDEIGEGNELNCLSLGGVGDGTILDFVECYVNFDDGFEWFGGTVDSTHLVSSMIGDDTFDLDQGFTGFNQFWFGVMPFFDESPSGTYGSKSGDKAGEWDGDDFAERSQDVNLRRGTNPAVTDDTPWPLAGPAIWNMTMIGSTPDVGSPCFAQTNGDNRGIQMRNGFAGRLNNSIITNTGTQTPLEVVVGDGSITGHDATNHAAAGLVSAMCTTIKSPTAPADAGALTNGDGLAGLLGCAPSGNNVVNNALWPGYVQPDFTFNPQGNAAGKLDAGLKASCGGPLNPRLGFGFVGVGGCCKPLGIGADRSATYRGAFDSSLPELWTTGWTALNRGGILAD
jgi:hypothetical protein